MSFLDELVKRGTIDSTQIEEIRISADENFKGDLDMALLDMGIPEEEILGSKGSYYNIPTKKVNVKEVSFDILKLIPEDSARFYGFAPLSLRDGVLEVGVVNPDNMESMDALQFISAKIGVPFKIFLISKRDYEEVMDSYEGVPTSVGDALDEIKEDTDKRESVNLDLNKENTDVSLDKEIKEASSGYSEKIVEDAPVIKIVAVVLRNAIEGGASDIHIENIGERVKVRYRVDGVLHTSIMLPVNVHSGIVARIKILAKMHLDEKRKPQDGSFSTVVEGRKIDFRVSTMPSYYGEKVVIRILDTETGLKSLEDLGLSEGHVGMLREAIKKPFGLILVTGPTGSGKSTTLYSMMNELDKEVSNIVTLEDPVEYEMADINQSQVMPEIGYTFANGLRSILRQDPDIIVVGEIRDKETAQLAIQAALTGHLVISTLHTNNSMGAIPRLIDMGVDPYLIAPTLILSVAQRLARRTCEASRKLKPLDLSTKMQLEQELADLPEEYRSKLIIKDQMYDTVSTGECPSGTRGRIGVFEMFEVDRELQNLILESPSQSDIYKIVRSKGMLTMRENAAFKAIDGIIPFSEVYKFNIEND